MGRRVIHFCDWCGVDSPHVGSVGQDWEILKNDGSSWICDVCSQEKAKAMAAVKAKCAGQSSGKAGGT